MKKNNLITVCILLYLLGEIVTGCTKNDTKFYDDGEENGLAIFSNTGNNVMSCYINGNPWRSRDRKSGFFTARAPYEVDINKFGRTNGLRDTLVINWTGFFMSDKQNISYVSLVLFVPHNAGYRYLSSLQGQRLTIDSLSGYFSTSMPGPTSTYQKGKGNIYFQTSHFDSTGTVNYPGKMSGIFDADFATFKITKGRFDHYLEGLQINL